MRIGLVSYRCKNRDLAFNRGLVERTVRETHAKADHPLSARSSPFRK